MCGLYPGLELWLSGANNSISLGDFIAAFGGHILLKKKQ
jgi:hypothetical protein